MAIQQGNTPFVLHVGTCNFTSFTWPGLGIVSYS